MGDPPGRPYTTLNGMMKMKWFLCVGLFLALVACAPTAVPEEPDIASRPTVIATAVAEAMETAGPTAVPPTPVPPPTATAPPETAVPEPTTFTPRFDRFLPFANPEGGSNSLTGLVRQGDGWQLARVPYPTGLYNEELGYALGTDSVDSDYAVATDRLLAWTFGGGAGPGNLAVGQLFIVNVATEEVEIVADNVVSAGWAPNGLDFAYILATPETYELRWRTAAGEDKLLAVDVPHTLKVSPDGRFVAFTRESWYEVDGTPPGLYVVPFRRLHPRIMV